MIPRLKNYPTEGAMTIANGAIAEFILGHKSANFLRVAEANASFRIRFDDTYEIAVSAGKSFDTLPDLFSKVEVINDSGGNLTFLLEIGTGKILSDEVVLSGTSNVADAAVLAAIQALDTSMQAALEEVEVEINDLITLHQNDQDKRKALRTLSGASYSAVTNATTTIVTGAANTAGIIVRRAFIDGTVGNAYLTAGGNRIMSASISGVHASEIEDLFIPAGQALAASSSGGSITVYTHYEVL